MTCIFCQPGIGTFCSTCTAKSSKFFALQTIKYLITRIGGYNFSGNWAHIGKYCELFLIRKRSLLHNKFALRVKVLSNRVKMFLNEIPQPASSVLVSHKVEKK